LRPSEITLEDRNNSGKAAIRSYIQKFLSNDAGATAIEYALICSLIACVIVAALTVLGSGLQNSFNEVSQNLK
jgi:pilus assembly protein Flp/PilA